ncbi:hypothetical protein DYBT9275_02825 [Dyadobacter sp. CECT 9275]|uniref:Uncharacterized protein n=1 Tax=Dyadobacter helix TaxID=2822344 RepID=A0A916N677_9BACT|nr:hypothetical protein [Dyadobacter sp. CECT 9275]CAG5002166.1 hypothetical protein DYBT9275_02825 [Dyadobacter sp. CECT 9275]
MNNGKIGFWGALVIVVLIYILREFLGGLSAFFFVPVDRLLFVTDSISPVIMWMLLGMFIGVVYGSFVAIKKYKLEWKLLFYPIGGLILLINIILLLSFVHRGNESAVVEKNITARAEEMNAAFNENLRKGIEAVDNEESTNAVYYFKMAVQSDGDNPKLDSLAILYSQIAAKKCKLYKRRSRLKYISNNYYKYAATLTSQTPEICK